MMLKDDTCIKSRILGWLKTLDAKIPEERKVIRKRNRLAAVFMSNPARMRTVMSPSLFSARYWAMYFVKPPQTPMSLNSEAREMGIRAIAISP